MPSLSGAPGCDSCLLLRQKVVELEVRLANLYQIKLDEQFIDSIVSVGPLHTHTHTGHLDSTLPCMNPNPDHTTAPWPLLGTKPTLPVNSTPHQPWRTAGRSKRDGRRSGRHTEPGQPLKLGNRYTTLMNEEEPPGLDDTPPQPALQRPRRPAPEKQRHHTDIQHRPRRPASHPGPSTQSASPRRLLPLDMTTSTLVIGSSMIRDVYIPPSPSGPCKVHCFPGARVRDIQRRLPSILAGYTKVSTIIVHVGTNDIRARQTEVLKADFTALLTTLMDTGRRIVISGPLPTYRRGAERWSRLFNLHTWLRATCASLDIDCVNNFDLFWERPSLLKHDGLHPNRIGASLLSDNMKTTLRH